MRHLILVGAVAIAATVVTSCDDCPTSPGMSGWRFLGPADAHVTTLAFDWPHLYAGSWSSGLYRWPVAGLRQEWENIKPRLAEDVEIFDNGDILVASGVWLERSGDNGRTWIRSDNGMILENGMSKVECLLQNGGVLYAGAHRIGLYTSNDHGLSWAMVSEDTLLAYHQLESYPDAPEVLFALCDRAFRMRVRISRDAGASWVQVPGAEFGYPEEPMSLAVDPRDNTIAYVGLTRGGVVKTSDGGVTWESIASLGEYEFVNAIAHDDSRSGHVFFAGHGVRGSSIQARARLFYSEDGGETVTGIDTPDMYYVRDMVYDAERGVLFVASVSGVFSYSVD